MLFATIAMGIGSAGSLVLGEIGLRVHRGELLALDSTYDSHNMLTQKKADYDARLGYVPRIGRFQTHFTATVDDQGLRSNGQPRPESGPVVLAVGDSFTFGDDVDDRETWPAILETRLGRPVLNGGVFGYGLGQIVLRAEMLLPESKPGILVLSFIPDDLDRSVMSYRYAWKPFFRLVEGDLELANVPVPERPPPVRYHWVRRILRYSRLADAIFGRLAPSWWLLEGRTQLTGEDAEAVASALMERLADRSRIDGIHVLVVAQSGPRMRAEKAAPVLDAARRAGLETLDLILLLREHAAADSATLESFFLNTDGGRFDGHMTPMGNAWVASEVEKRFVSLGW